MYAYRNCIAALLIIALFGCGGESIDLTPRTADTGAAGSDAGMEQDSGMRNEMADAGEPVDQVWPNLELFVATIQPIMVGCGGLTCHKAEMVTLDDTFLQFETSPGGVITEAQAANNFAEFTQERMIDYEEPAESKFLRHHRTGHPGHIPAGTQTDGLVIAWINDALTPPSMMMMNPDEVVYRCDEVEITDQQLMWRDGFISAEINAMLVGTPDMPDGRCGGSDCHAGPGAGRLLFAPPEIDCTVDYNFLEAVDWVNRDDVLASPLLVEPLGEPSQETGRIEHGGRVVFNGRDDPDYILLRRWIESR